LFDGQRERERRQAEHRERQERAAVEADRLWRSRVWQGVPADHLPIGVSAGDAMALAAKDSLPKRQSPLEEALGGESMVYHTLPRAEDEL
jgi:hypothetical protein